MAVKNIYETEAVREFVAGMSPLSRRKYLVARQVLQDVGYLRAPEGDGHQDSQTAYRSVKMISKEELARGIARTQSDMDVAMRDPALRNEVSAVEARYAALALLEGYFKTAAGSRKLSAYRDSYHRDFIFTVSLDAQDDEPVSCATRELAFG